MKRQWVEGIDIFGILRMVMLTKDEVTESDTDEVDDI